MKIIVFFKKNLQFFWRNILQTFDKNDICILLKCGNFCRLVRNLQVDGWTKPCCHVFLPPITWRVGFWKCNAQLFALVRSIITVNHNHVTMFCYKIWRKCNLLWQPEANIFFSILLSLLFSLEKYFILIYYV